MASRLDTTRVEDSTTQYWHPVVPAVAFVALVALLNGALNGLVAGIRGLPAPLQYDYAVTVPLAPLGAGLVAIAGGLLTVCALALFVRSVGTPTSGELEPGSVDATLLWMGRGTAVAVLGLLATLLGLALLVVPGLVVLVYLPFVFLGVVLDGRTVAGAIDASHTRVSARPLAVAGTSLGTVSTLFGVAFLGVATSVLPPTVEFVVGGVTSALVVLLGTYVLTRLYQRPSPEPSSQHGQL